MEIFDFWPAAGLFLATGVALGMILMGFLAIGTYERGYKEGFVLRRPWRAELGARREAVIEARRREMRVAVPTAVVVTPSVAASGG